MRRLLHNLFKLARWDCFKILEYDIPRHLGFFRVGTTFYFKLWGLAVFYRGKTHSPYLLQLAGISFDHLAGDLYYKQLLIEVLLLRSPLLLLPSAQQIPFDFCIGLEKFECESSVLLSFETTVVTKV